MVGGSCISLNLIAITVLIGKNEKKELELLFFISCNFLPIICGNALPTPLVFLFSVGLSVACPKCKKHFCLDCDIYILESLHNCPACESLRHLNLVAADEGWQIRIALGFHDLLPPLQKVAALNWNSAANSVYSRLTDIVLKHLH